MEEKRFISHSHTETEGFGRELGLGVKGDEVIAMFGGLGMGKTAFVRGLAEGLGVPPETVSSPTFAIVHEHSGRVRLYHYDMYRVETWEELDSTGFFEAVGNGVVAVEWSENIENALPVPRYELRISSGENENERDIMLSYITSQEGEA